MSSSRFPDSTPFELTLGVGGAERAEAPAPREEVLRLFGECAPRLRRYVRSLGLTQEGADDVVQEAFLALYRHLSLGRSRENLQGWLFQVSYRTALKSRERLARRQRREAPWEPGAAESVADTAENPETRMVRRQRRRRLQAIVDALPERDRQCLFLRAEGLRYREIAQALGVSLGAVAKSLTRTVSKLTSI